MESFKEKAISEQLFCFQISELDSDLLIVRSCDAEKKKPEKNLILKWCPSQKPYS